MPLSVTLRIPIDDAVEDADLVSVYSNGGSGAVDYGEAITPRPVRLFRQVPRPRAYGVGGVCGKGQGVGRPREYGRQRYGAEPPSRPAPQRSVGVRMRYAFGPHTLGVALVGATGNITGTPYEVDVFLAPVNPPPVLGNSFKGYASGTDQVTIGFVDQVE